MDAGGAIVALNVVLGVGCSWPLARHWAGVLRTSGGRRAAFAILLLIYLAESAAFSASMGTSIFSMALACLWGPLLARRWRAATAVKLALILTLFRAELHRAQRPTEVIHS